MNTANWFSAIRDRLQHIVTQTVNAVRSRRRDVQTVVDTMEDRCLLSAPHPFDLSSLSTGDGSVGTVFNGVAAGDQSGYSARTAGDINGDGYDDFVVGAYRAIGDAQGPLEIGGEAYVIFGTPVGLPAEVELSDLDGTNGFRIPGQDDRTAIGLTVGSVGDVNGDGFHDLFIDGYNADHPNRVGNNGRRVGEAYIIFGRTEAFPAVFDTDTLDGTNGFTMVGTNDFDFLGLGGFAGDINGDGFDDVIISAVNKNGTLFKEVYVIYGKAAGFPEHIFVTDLDGTDGFTIPAINSDDRMSRFPSKAGDMNGDGFADIVFGASRSDLNGEDSGSGYVLFGQAAPFPSSFDLTTLDGTNGFQFRGIEAGDWAGERTQFVGDLNGDGFHDIGIGADRSDSDTGEAYVIFGAASGFPAVLELSNLNGTNGVKFLPIDSGDQLGISISTVGDLDGDGYDDLGLGAHWADPGGVDRAGEVYVVFGTPTGWAATYDLTTLDGDNGFRLEGTAASDLAGKFVNTAGDFNGDGFSELLIGANAADPGGISAAGRTYMILGADFRDSVTHAGDETDNTLTGDAAANVMIGGRGDDVIRGGGGADVLRGGQGDDILGISDLTFQRVDGGLGHDTLSLDGGGMVVDIADINDARLTSIETIDVTGSGDNSLTLNILDVLNLSDTTNTLLVRRDDGDVVNIGTGWTQQADEVIGLAVFEVYTAGQAVVKVQDAQAVVSTVTLSVSANAGTEAAMTAITVTVNGDRTVFSDQTVDLIVTGPGITAEDYVLTDGDATKSGIQIKIASGTMSGSEMFTVSDDGFVEALETATLTLANPTLSLVLGDPKTQDITITSDDAPGFTVTETSTSTRVTEAAGIEKTDTFSVVLDARPASDVVLDLQNSDTSEISLSATDLTFTSANWDTPQIVIVTGIDEPTVDGDQISVVTVSINDAASDDAFDGLPDQTVSVTTIDDDVAGLRIAETSGSTIVAESGTTDQFDVSLTGQPLTNVVLAISNPDPGEVLLDQTTLTFTPTNWDQPQTVIATGADDPVVDGDQTTGVTISVTDASSDDAFDQVADETVDIVTTDDDARFIVIETDGDTQVAESGTFDSIDVVLKAQPPSDVVLTITVDDGSEATVDKTMLTFTPSDWDSSQTVNITGVDDPIVDGDVLSTLTLAVDVAASDPAFAGVPPQSFDITTTDDDVAGYSVTETGGSTVVSETGTMDEFDIVLDAAPLTDVVFTISSGDTTEATADVASVTFTPTNWNMPQTVTVIGQDDPTVDGDQITVMTVAVDKTASDDAFDGLADFSVSVTTTDDDTAGFSVAPMSLTVSEAGSSEIVDVVLTSQPLTDVVLSINVTDATEASANRSSVTFSSSNWDSPQSVVVSGVDDVTVDGDRLSELTVSIDSDGSDDAFDPLPNKTVAITTTDDDIAGFTITESAGTTSVDEDGSTDSFEVVLNRQPLSSVVLTLTETDSGEITADLNSLTFTPSDWDKPQTVIVTGEDDIVVDATQQGDIVVAIDPSSTDDAFDAVAAQTVLVTNTDNDSATLVVDSISQNETDAGAALFTFTVTLDTEVDVPVVVDFATRDDSALASDNDYVSRSGSLTFAAGSSPGTTLPITVNVTGDARVEMAESFFAELSNVQAGNRNVSVTTARGIATILNDDAATVSIANTEIIEGDSGTGSIIFTVMLTSEVDVPVNVSYATANDSATLADDDYEVATGVLTFPANGLPGNLQTLEVTVNGDELVELDEQFLVRLSNLTAAGRDVTFDQQEATGTIRNDDAATISVVGVTAPEGDAASSDFIFDVVLTGEVDQPISLDLKTLDGTATVADGDYDPQSNRTVSFPAYAGSDPQTIAVAVPVFGDTITERDETFALELSQLIATGRDVSFSGGSANLVAQATITNDDGAQVSIDDVSLTESDSGTTTAIFTVTLSGRTDADVEVDFATADGSATVSGGDYGAASGTLLFSSMTTVQSQTATFAVPVNGDGTVELDEFFEVNLTLASAANRNVLLGDSLGQATILNDDSASIRVSDVTQLEGNSGATLFDFDVILSDEVDVPVVVRFATGSETARPADNDFDFTSGSITFDADFGPGEQTQRVSVTVNGDIKVEANETFLLNLSQISAENRSVAFTDSQAVGTILDEDEATVTIGDAVASEGDSGLMLLEFDVTLHGIVDTAVAVNYATADETTETGIDYIGRSGTISFVANSGSATQTVKLDVQVSGDEVVELNESMLVQLSNLVSFGRVTLDDDAGRGTILNDDTGSLVIDDVTIAEGDSGNSVAEIHVTLNRSVDVPLTVDFQSTDGTAQSGDDYVAVSGTLTFSGQAGEQQTVSVPIIGDYQEENPDTFFIDIHNLQTTGRAVSISRTQGTVTIVNDDGVPLDVDSNGSADAATDGILIIRYLFGFRNDALTSGAVDSSADRDSTAIEQFLGSIPQMLDVDGNGSADAATDGILILRYLFGFIGPELVESAIGQGAIRTTGPEISAFLDGFRNPPSAPAPSPFSPNPTLSDSATSSAPSSLFETSNPRSKQIVDSELLSTSFVENDRDRDLFEWNAATDQRPVMLPRDETGDQPIETFPESTDWLDLI